MFSMLTTPKYMEEVANKSKMIESIKAPENYGLTPSMIAAQTNPFGVIQSEQFPDIVQHFPNQECKALLNQLKHTNNSNLVNKKGKQGGYTPLHWMCIKNEYDLIEFLIRECNADINAKSELGETPLFICIKNCNFQSIELLIENGADLNARDIYDRSIIHWSAYTGKVVLFYYLKKYHSINNLNDRDKFQQNALHIACASGYIDLIKYLLGSGEIDLFAQDINGNTCLHMAAKCGLPRVCWQITQKSKGDCIRLIEIENNQKQTPYEMIRFERAPHFKKIREWLRNEHKTNPKLNNTCNKKSDSVAAAHFRRRKFRIFSRTSIGLLRIEWFMRFIAFFAVVTIPKIISNILFARDELSIWNGILVYSSYLVIVLILINQKHRISHISGAENPFFIGYFFAFFIHNHYVYYFEIIYPFNITKFIHFGSIILMLAHWYTLYKILFTDPGYVHESIKKPDGTPYELHDLMKFKNHERNQNFNGSKNSLNWLLRPSLSENDELSQAYFCESCCVIQAAPTKHCKLCDQCCQKFDHHCIYVNKCIGLKNHKYFISFVITTMLNDVTFILILCYQLYKFYSDLCVKHLEQPIEDRISFSYYLIASSYHVWFVTLIVMNGLPMFMVIVLLLLQLRVLSLGYTSQYPPPYGFGNMNKNMKTCKMSLKHRLDNLYIFFFKSPQANLDLFYNQQKLYNDACNEQLKTRDNQAIPKDYYPKDEPINNSLLFNEPSFFQNNNNINSNNGKLALNYTNTDSAAHNTTLLNLSDNILKKNSNSSNNNLIKQNQFEIDLD